MTRFMIEIIEVSSFATETPYNLQNESDAAM